MLSCIALVPTSVVTTTYCSRAGLTDPAVGAGPTRETVAHPVWQADTFPAIVARDRRAHVVN